MHKAYTDNNLDDEIIAYCRCGRLVRFSASEEDGNGELKLRIIREAKMDERAMNETADVLTLKTKLAKAHNSCLKLDNNLLFLARREDKQYNTDFVYRAVDAEKYIRDTARILNSIYLAIEDSLKILEEKEEEKQRYD